jgi:hypothetical protein
MVVIIDTRRTAQLKAVINFKRENDPEGLNTALSQQRLMEYLWLERILYGLDPSLIYLYQRSIWQFEMQHLIGQYMLVGSYLVDDTFFDHAYEKVKGPVGTEPSLVSTAVGSVMSDSVVERLHEIKVVSFTGSVWFGFLGLKRVFFPGRINFGLGGILGLLFISEELMCISYGAYERNYREKYGDMLVGDVTKVLRTMGTSLTATLGLSPQTEAPLYKLRRRIAWSHLAENTMCKRLFEQVRTPRLLFFILKIEIASNIAASIMYTFTSFLFPLVSHFARTRSPLAKLLLHRFLYC